MEIPELREQYLGILHQIEQEMTIMKQYPELLTNDQVKECLEQVSLLSLQPFSIEVIQKLAYYLETVREFKKEITSTQGGQSHSYTKVKKGTSGMIFESEQLNTPPLFDPTLIPHAPIRGKEFPSYMFNNKGVSNPIMLAFLTFLFEAIFLVTSYFLYQ